MIRAAADRGDLDGVKALRAARKQFQTDGTLPELKEPAAKGAKIRYERAVKVAPNQVATHTQRFATPSRPVAMPRHRVKACSTSTYDYQPIAKPDRFCLP